VVGMLLGAGLARAWPHDRAHYFFARARWEAGELGLGPPRIFRTALLVLFHAASCRFRYSSWASCGVL